MGGLFPYRSELPILSDRGEISSQSASPLVLLKKQYKSWDDLFASRRLNGRGWTLQERELSPRILYFTKHTMLFECRRSRNGAPGRSSWTTKVEKAFISKQLQGTNQNHTVDRCLDRLSLIRMGTPFVIFKEECYNAWKDMTEGYSRRRLSMMPDKFPAVSDLASEFAYVVDDEYIGGLWRKDLCRGLSWRGSETMTRHLKGVTQQASQLQVSNDGPSWSWAKMTIPISYDLGRYQEGRHPQTLTSSNLKLGEGNL